MVAHSPFDYESKFRQMDVSNEGHVSKVTVEASFKEKRLLENTFSKIV